MRHKNEVWIGTYVALIAVIGLVFWFIFTANTVKAAPFESGNSALLAMDRLYGRMEPKEGQHELPRWLAKTNFQGLAIQNATNCEIWIGTRVDGKIQWHFAIAPQKAYTTQKAGDICQNK